MGALEDEDEEVYHRDAMSNYDMVLGGEEPGDGLYGWTAPQQYKKKKGTSGLHVVHFLWSSSLCCTYSNMLKTSLYKTFAFLSFPLSTSEKNSDVSYLGKILEGFTLASKTGEVKTVSLPVCRSLSVSECLKAI